MKKLILALAASAAVVWVQAAAAETIKAGGVTVDLGNVGDVVSQSLRSSSAVAAGSIVLPANWKFEIDPDNAGVAKGWHKAQFDASAWRMIEVPADWERFGVTTANPLWPKDDLDQPYSGYAWYRTQVTVPAEWQGRAVYLNLGYIDDLDWTYWNGVPVGETTTRQATDRIARTYPVPPNLIRFGKPNTIAVRVLDIRGLGGLTKGPHVLTVDRAQTYGDGGSSGRSGNDLVRIGSDVLVARGQKVADAVAVMGDVTVLGEVTGDAVAVMGTVLVRDGGVVHGDAVAVGGRVTQNEGGTVNGTVSSVTVPTPFGKMMDWPFGGLMTWVFLGVFEAILMGVLAVFAAALFPDRMRVIEEAVLARPGLSALYAVLGAAAGLVVAGLLLITCIGIPLIVVEVLFLFVGKIAGQAGARMAVGTRVSEAFGRPVSSPIAAVLIGTLVLLIVGLVPVAGGIVVLVIDCVGFGAALMTGLGSRIDWLPSRLSSHAPPPPVPAP